MKNNGTYHTVGTVQKSN